MLAAYCLLAIAAVLGLWIRSGSGWQEIAKAGAVFVPVSLLPAILYNDSKQYDERNAALALPWVFMLVVVIPPLAILSVRFEFPLRDAFFASMDRALGFNVPAIATWISAHPFLCAISDRSYNLLFLLLPAAMFIPPLIGKREASETFIVANTAALLISFPIFTLLPAIGPWVNSTFPGNEAQQACQATIVALHSGSTTAAVAGVVCFPSFHTIWALLSARSLWSLRWLRIPAALVAGAVVISTVTTGWHYVVDVLAAFLVAAASLRTARWVVMPAPSVSVASNQFPSAVVPQ
jgi:hypothetical protein